MNNKYPNYIKLDIIVVLDTYDYQYIILPYHVYHQFLDCDFMKEISRKLDVQLLIMIIKLLLNELQCVIKAKCFLVFKGIVVQLVENYFKANNNNKDKE